MFVESPTEQTTAITDLLIAVQAMVAITVLRRTPARLPMWTKLWIWFFGLLALASFLGAVSHGIKMIPAVDTVLWMVAYLALGIMMAIFSIAAVAMHWSPEHAKRCLPFGVAIAFTFFLITQLWSDSFLLFVIYEAISMLLALILYLSCFWIRREQGSGFLVSGILVGIVAAVVDTQSSLKVTLLWTFDNHGIFHLVQMVSLLLLTIGVYSTHQAASMNGCSTTAESYTDAV